MAVVAEVAFQVVFGVGKYQLVQVSEDTHTYNDTLYMILPKISGRNWGFVAIMSSGI